MPVQNRAVSHNDDAEDVQLASAFTISDYRAARSAQERLVIADAMRRRFRERYIRPVACASPSLKNGFTIMAVACLLIEAFESFRLGLPTTQRKSRQAFRSFFKAADGFGIFRGHEDDFYTHVRCGILHQAETTGAWRILRKGPLFVPAAVQVNATRFINRLDSCVDRHCSRLTSLDWSSIEWRNTIKKFDAIVVNAGG
jgi:hypothetical protein